MPIDWTFFAIKGKALRKILNAVELSTALINFIAVLCIFTAYNTAQDYRPFFLTTVLATYYMYIWMFAEGINFLAVLHVNVVGEYKFEEYIKRIYISKAISIAHYVIVLYSTAGVLCETQFINGTYEPLNTFRYILIANQLFVWWALFNVLYLLSDLTRRLSHKDDDDILLYTCFMEINVFLFYFISLVFYLISYPIGWLIMLAIPSKFKFDVKNGQKHIADILSQKDIEKEDSKQVLQEKSSKKAVTDYVFATLKYSSSIIISDSLFMFVLAIGMHGMLSPLSINDFGRDLVAPVLTGLWIASKVIHCCASLLVPFKRFVWKKLWKQLDSLLENLILYVLVLVELSSQQFVYAAQILEIKKQKNFNAFLLQIIGVLESEAVLTDDNRRILGERRVQLEEVQTLLEERESRKAFTLGIIGLLKDSVEKEMEKVKDSSIRVAVLLFDVEPPEDRRDGGQANDVVGDDANAPPFGI